jgi:phage-related protein (TIGR01555 family)
MMVGDAWRWSRLYGGGLVVMAVDDGQSFDKPLDLSQAKRFRGLTTVDSSCVLVQGYIASIGSVAWSPPSGYQVISPWTFGAGGTGRLNIANKPIHPSRVIRFDGCRVPASMMINNGGWAPSVLQRCKKQLDAYGSAYAYAQEILHDLSVMLVKLTGFNDMLLGDNGIADARETLRQLRWGIDNLNLLVIDKESSDYQEVKRSVEGLEKMLMAFERDLVGASGMSRLILVGEQASGLGASSSDEVRSWYSSVENEQKYTVTPALNRLLEVVFACRRNSGEQVPSEWSIKYAPLWTPEPKAKAEIAQIWADTVTSLVAAQVITQQQGLAMLVHNGVLEDLPENSAAVGIEPAPNDLEANVPVETPADADEPVLSKDPVPTDAETPREIALALGVSTIRVTRLVSQGRVRLWNKLGKRVISLAEVHAVIEADNTLEE